MPAYLGDLGEADDGEMWVCQPLMHSHWRMASQMYCKILSTATSSTPMFVVSELVMLPM